MAPEAVRTCEWGVFRPGTPHLVHPAMFVVRDGELAEQPFACFAAWTSRCPYSHKRDIDQINAHITAFLVDPPSEQLDLFFA